MKTPERILVIIKKFYIFEILTVVLIDLLFTIYFKQDISFDLKNYHLYNAYSFIIGTYSKDILIPGLANSLPTLIEIPIVLIGTVSPFLMTLFANILQSLNIIPLFLISSQFIKNRPLSFLISIISTFGVGYLSEAGTLFMDNIISIPILFMVYLLIFKIIPTTSYKNKFVYIYGILAGISLALKLTTIIYIIPLILLLLVFKFRNIKVLFLTLLFSILSFFIFSSPYYLTNYNRWESPIYPLYNQFFQSSYATLVNFKDERFNFKHTIDYIQFPIIMLKPNLKYSEIPMWENKFLIYLLSLPISLLYLIKNRVDKSFKEIFIASLFIFLSYFIWGYLFGIYRYFIPTEILLTTITAVILYKISNKSIIFTTIFLFVQLILTFSFFVIPNWGRSSFTNNLVSQSKDDNVLLSNISNSHIILRDLFPYEEPNSYIRLLLNNSNQMTRLAEYGGLYTNKIKQLVNTVLDDDKPKYFITSKTGYSKEDMNTTLSNWNIMYALKSIEDCNKLNLQIGDSQTLYYICKLGKL